MRVLYRGMRGGGGGEGGRLFTVRASTRSLFSRDVSTANWNEQFNDGETPLLVPCIIMSLSSYSGG